MFGKGGHSIINGDRICYKKIEYAASAAADRSIIMITKGGRCSS